MTSTYSRQQTTRATVPAIAPSLQPELRDRLIEELDHLGIPAKARQAYITSLTSRAPQTVSRWLDSANPGLPDLDSFVRLCVGLGRSSDTLLGLMPKLVDPVPVSSEESVIGDWARAALQGIRAEAADCEVRRMRGDEMDPIIRDGDLIFVDRSSLRIDGNGIYVLELDGRTVVRRVEAELGPGLTLKCELPGYRDQVVEDEAAAVRLGLRVLGKVRAASGVTRFWRR